MGAAVSLVVATNQYNQLTVTDSRYPVTIFYQLSYVGSSNGGPSFQVTWSGDPLALSCIEIEESGVENDFMQFSNLNQAHNQYLTLVFQGEQYNRIG